MLNSIFATKIGMSQAWDVTGRRWAVTKCQVQPNMVVRQQDATALIGYGSKKLKNMSKPLRSQLEKSGFALGVKKIQGVAVTQSEESDQVLKPGDQVKAESVLKVGDVVKVQGASKGHGFSGAMKRHGFHGGPKTHGQSDRSRAVGSIGAGTTPGKVFKGKKMPGHFGVETTTVARLVVLHIDTDTQEVWLSGPVPGHFKSTITITPIGQSKTVSLDAKASGIVVKEAAPAAEAASAEETAEVQS